MWSNLLDATAALCRDGWRRELPFLFSKTVSGRPVHLTLAWRQNLLWPVEHSGDDPAGWAEGLDPSETVDLAELEALAKGGYP
jgi:hypothetical protein